MPPASLSLLAGCAAPHFVRASYSVRRASTGSSRAAFRAGNTPASSPMVMAMPSASRTKLSGVCTGRAGSAKWMSWARPKPRMSPNSPPSADSATASPRNSAARCTEGDEQADFTGAFGDGDGHDGDDADATDQQGNAAERADGHGQHVEDVGQRFQHLFLGDDGEILAAVALDQVRLDAAGDEGRRNAFLGGDVDFTDPSAVEQLLATGRRDEGGVVKVDAEELALWRHDADHPEMQAADAQALAERIVAAEQLVLELGAEDNEGARAVFVVGRQELPALHGRPENLRKLGIDAIDQGSPGAAIAFDFGIAAHIRRDGDDVGQALEGLGVVER